MNPQNPSTSSASDVTGAGGSTMERPGKISQAKEAITHTAREAAAKIKSATSDTAAKARSEAERFAAEKKDTAAERIGGYSSAIHDSARSLEETDPNIAWFTHQAADRVQRVADYVRTHDFNALREDCCSFARQHPAAFFGGMFVAGLLLGNMMKATARPREDENSFDYEDSDWRREAPGYGAEPTMQNELPMSTSPTPGNTSGISGI